MTKRTMIQYFEWYLKSDPPLYQTLMKEASSLSKMGFTHVWLPPAYKGQAGINDVGYGVYDMYDLGEFDQKGSIRTKYGTKDEYIQAIDVCHQNSLQVIADIVFNHRMGADEKETIKATAMDWDDRNRAVGQEKIVDVWTKYTFPVRNGKYSKFQWTWKDFDGTDYDAKTNQNVLMTFENKKWDPKVSKEEGNFDFIMGDDLDFQNPNVIEELYHWGKWYKDFTNIDGYRLDAIKSIDSNFFKGWLDKQKSYHTNDVYAVGEYWKNDTESLEAYLSQVEYNVDLFDVALHYNLNEASEKGRDYDLRDLLKGTLVEICPDQAVTFVDNHDSQKNSSLESQVKDWFKPSAYGLILLMKKGYPCIFYGDYYGVKGKKSPHRKVLDMLLRARKEYAYGEEVDYFDHPNTIGFVRLGDSGHADSGLALVISNGEDGEKTMSVGENRKGEVWHEITGSVKDTVAIDEEGKGRFLVKGGKLAVWVKVKA